MILEYYFWCQSQKFNIFAQIHSQILYDCKGNFTMLNLDFFHALLIDIQSLDSQQISNN